MNKWEDPFMKSADKHDNKPCHCKNEQGLFIPGRQLSALVAGILSVSFCIFITGYFLGKRELAQQFIQGIQQDCQEDTASLSQVACEVSTHQDGDSSLVVAVENSMPSIAVAQNETLVTQDSTSPLDEDIKISTDGNLSQYYAQLIGFGTEKAAQQFAKKLSDKGVFVEVKKRVSKTVKGRVSYWYQVITAPYHDKNDLLSVVDKLVKEEKLKGVCIRSC